MAPRITRSFHKKLAEYYDSKPLYLDESIQNKPNIRKIVELPWQQTNAKTWNKVSYTLSNLSYIEARCRIGQVFELITDFNLAQRNLPERKIDYKKQQKELKQIAEWNKAMISYSDFWSKKRKKNGIIKDTQKSKVEIPTPPPSYHFWSKGEIKKTTDQTQLNPNRTDRLNSFEDFIRKECYILHNFSKRQSFVIQHAWNSSPDGIVHDSAEEAITLVKNPMILNRWHSESSFNPVSAVIMTLYGHNTRVENIAISNDGKIAISADDDILSSHGASIRVWDLNSGKCINIIRLDEEKSYIGVDGFSLSYGSSLLVSVDYRSIRIFDLSTGEIIETFKQKGQTKCCAITPDGSCAVYSEKDYSLKVFLPENTDFTIKSNEIEDREDESIDLICISPDGNYVFTGSDKGKIRIWDLRKRCLIRVLNNEKESLPNLSARRFRITFLTYSPVVNQLFSVDSDHAFQAWDITTGLCVFNINIKDINSLALTADAKYAVMASNDEISILDIQNQKCTHSINYSYDPVTSISITPDGKRALTGSENGLLKLWDLEKGTSKPALEYNYTVNCMTLTDRGDYLLVGVSDKTIRVLDTRNGKLAKTINCDCLISFIGLPGDENFCFSADNTGNLRVWNLKTGDCIKKIDNNGRAIKSVAITKDGNCAITGEKNGTITIWDLNSGKILKELSQNHSENAPEWQNPADWRLEELLEGAYISITPDDRRIISIGRNVVTEVWDILSGKCLHTFLGHKGDVNQILFNAKGSNAYSSGEDGNIMVWDLTTGRKQQSFKCFDDSILLFVLSPEEDYVAACNYNGIIKIIEVESGRTAGILRGHTGPVNKILFTPDRRYIISSGRDKTIRFWDIRNENELGIFSSQEDINNMLISKDGRTVFYSNNTGNVITLEVRGIKYSDSFKVSDNNTFGDYEQILRDGFSYCLDHKGAFNEETLAHLEALVIHLEHVGKTEESKSVIIKRDEIEALVKDYQKEKDLQRWLSEARSGRDDLFTIAEGQELWCIESLIELKNKQGKNEEAIQLIAERTALLEKENQKRMDILNRTFESAEEANQICVKEGILQKLWNLNFVSRMIKWLRDSDNSFLIREEKIICRKIEEYKKELSQSFEENNLSLSGYSSPDELCDPVINKLTDILVQILYSRYDISLVSIILGYLIISRQGFREEELLDIIESGKNKNFNGIIKREGHEKTLIELSGLFNELMQLLAISPDDESEVSIKLPVIIQERLKKSIEGFTLNESTLHQELADYHLSRLKSCNNFLRGNDFKKSLTECIFHLMHGGELIRASEYLCDFSFLINRMHFNLFDFILEDFYNLNLLGSASIRTRITPWLNFLQENAHLLRRGSIYWPSDKIFTQLAFEQGDKSPVSKGADRWIYSSKSSVIWLHKQIRPVVPGENPCRLVINTMDNNIYSDVIVLFDGKFLTWTVRSVGGENSDFSELHFWDDRIGNCYKTIRINKNGVKGVRQIDEKRLLAWSSHSMQIIDIEKEKCIAILENYSSYVEDVLFLPENKILSWSSDGNGKTLWLWSSTNGKCLAPFEGHKKGVLGVLLIKNEKVVSWSWDNDIRIWDKEGNPLSVLKGHYSGINGVLELSDNRILSWGEDLALRIWSIETGKELAFLEGHNYYIGGVLVLPNGNIISWCGSKNLNRDIIDNIPRIWNQKNGKCIANLVGHTKAIKGIQVLSDGRPISWSEDGTVRIWCAESGKCKVKIDDFASSLLELSGNRILTWSRELRIWDLNSGKCIKTFIGHDSIIIKVQVLTDDRILSFDSEGNIRVWDKVNSYINNEEESTCWIDSLLLIDKNRIISFSNKHIEIWDVQSGFCIKTFDRNQDILSIAKYLESEKTISWEDTDLNSGDYFIINCLLALDGHVEEVEGVLRINKGTLITWSKDKIIRLWDSRNGKFLFAFDGHKKSIMGSLRISDEQFLSWSSDSYLYKWDICKRFYKRTKSKHTDDIRGVLALNPERLATWSFDRTIILWDLVNLKTISICKGHIGTIEGLLDLDNERFLSWSEDKTLRIWDKKSGSCLSFLQRHSDPVAGAVKLSESEILSWSKGDYFHQKEMSLIVWDSNTGDCLQEISEQEALTLHPEWLYECVRSFNPAFANSDFFILASDYCIRLCSRFVRGAVVFWHYNSKLTVQYLLSDAKIVITAENDSNLHFISLYNGKSRISLNDYNNILTSGENCKHFNLDI